MLPTVHNTMSVFLREMEQKTTIESMNEEFLDLELQFP